MATNRDGFRVEGLSRVVRGLRALGLDVEDLKDAFSRIAKVGADKTRGYVPVKSGRLRDDVRGNRAQSKAVITAGRASIRYAGPQNYGWPARNIQPSGFMQRGDAVMRPVALDLLEDDINDKIRERGLA